MHATWCVCLTDAVSLPANRPAQLIRRTWETPNGCVRWIICLIDFPLAAESNPPMEVMWIPNKYFYIFKHMGWTSSLVIQAGPCQLKSCIDILQLSLSRKRYTLLIIILPKVLLLHCKYYIWDFINRLFLSNLFNNTAVVSGGYQQTHVRQFYWIVENGTELLSMTLQRCT